MVILSIINIGDRMKNKVLIEALILGAGQIGGKLLSMIFIFSLSKDTKSLGLYLYTYAYIPFSLFLDISAFGIIPGISKCVSTHLAKDEILKVNYLLKIGSILMIIIGIMFFILLNVFNEKIISITIYQGYSEFEYNVIKNNLRLASLSLLVYPLLSFYKGYFQGNMKMAPSSIAIIGENLVRVLLYLAIAKDVSILIFEKTFFINFISYSVALLFMIILVAKNYFKKKEKYNVVIDIYKTSLPFGVVTMFFTMYQLIDSITLSKLNIDSHIYTAYMFEMTRLIFIPIVFAQSIGGALCPKMNSFVLKNEFFKASKYAEVILALVLYILVPCIVLYQLFSKQIYEFFYNNGNNYKILSYGAILILFIGFYKSLIGISQGVNKFYYVVIATFISLASKTILNLKLVGVYSYLGAIISTIISITICIFISYYVLSKSKINLLLKNAKALLIALIFAFISIFLSTIYNLSFLILLDSKMQNIFYAIFIVLFYILFISLYKLITVSNKRLLT